MSSSSATGSATEAPEITPQGGPSSGTGTLPAGGPTIGGAGMVTAAVTDRPGVQVDGSRRLIRTLTVTVFLQWMGATAIVPMLPVYIRHLGGSDAWPAW